MENSTHHPICRFAKKGENLAPIHTSHFVNTLYIIKKLRVNRKSTEISRNCCISAVYTSLDGILMLSMLGDEGSRRKGTPPSNVTHVEAAPHGGSQIYDSFIPVSLMLPSSLITNGCKCISTHSLRCSNSQSSSPVWEHPIYGLREDDGKRG